MTGNARSAAPLAVVDVWNCIRATRAIKESAKLGVESQLERSAESLSAEVMHIPEPSALDGGRKQRCSAACYYCMRRKVFKVC